MLHRIFGIETEYGLLINQEQPDRPPSWIAHQIIDHLFRTKRAGVLDLHHRGYDEPPGNGGFLLNGGRMYVDMGHLEFASPECHSLRDLVASDRAGDWLLQDAIEELGLSENVSVIKNNIDHETDATFGCHENYLVSRNFPFSYNGLGKLIPFLVTRQIFTGAGRIGATENIDGWIPLEQLSREPDLLQQPSNRLTIPYQISQRADYIVNDFFEWVQHNRAIINTRDEPLADPTQFRRIHLLVGDSNLSEIATALKMGTTGLVLQLIEDGHAPNGLDFTDPVEALRQVSRDQERTWMLTLATGETLSAIDIQERFLECAQTQYQGQDEETDWILQEWEEVLRDLRGDYTTLVGRVDWASKLWLLETFRQQEHLAWEDPWLKSLDLEYHNVDPHKGLYFGLMDEGKAPCVTTRDAIELAKYSPPRDTRAFGRGEVIRYLADSSWSGIQEPEDEARQFPPYVINWSVFQVRGSKAFIMPDPFRSYIQEVRTHLKL
ncbi:MAG: proteasome accessory factor PafA2 [Nitrospirales bacterium]|nr:MAG: proteasome accessory factor PafA2 [Nitrospirales bacterium]